MVSQLPGGFHIGQTIEYGQWAVPYKEEQVDRAVPDEQSGRGIVHTGFIAGYTHIQAQFYYMVMCGRKIELVLPEDIQSEPSG